MRIPEPEREVLTAEVAAAAGRLPDGAARETYRRLLDAIGGGEVPEADLPALERLVEAGLESGRIRAVHLAHGEMAAMGFFSRTPRARALRETIDQANEGLAALNGAELRQLAFSLRGPGAYTLTLNTTRCHATLVIDRHGVRVQSVEVGG